MALEYNVFHHKSDCGNTTTSIIWKKISIIISHECVRLYDPVEPCEKYITFISPAISGINKYNRHTFKLFEIDSETRNIRICENNPFWNILKKDKYYQYCKLFPVFLRWMKLCKQQIHPQESFVETLYNKSLINDPLIPVQAKEDSKFIFEELDILYHAWFCKYFEIKREINVKLTEIKAQLNIVDVKLRIDDCIKKIIFSRKLMKKYINVNVYKHGIIFHSVHLLIFEHIKCRFNIVQINEDFVKMNKFEYEVLIVECLDKRLNHVKELINMVMGYYDDLMENSQLEKIESYIFFLLHLFVAINDMK